jgi:polyisoprenoid-binding protein YceI
MNTRLLFPLVTLSLLGACAPDPSRSAPAATVGEARPAEAAPTEGVEAAGAEGGEAAAAAEGGEAAAPEAAAPAPGVTLSFGPNTGSTVGFIGSKVTASHEGSFGDFTGTIELRDPVETSTVSVTIQTASLVADSDRLTGHLKSDDFFSVEAFPTATFQTTGIAANAEAPYTHTLTGPLTMRGVARDISFPATIAVTDTQVTATAEFSINRSDWGITYTGMADDLIREGVVIRFSIVAPRSN